jgi:hypothetical protein
VDLQEQTVQANVRTANSKLQVCFCLVKLAHAALHWRQPAAKRDLLGGLQEIDFILSDA